MKSASAGIEPSLRALVVRGALRWSAWSSSAARSSPRRQPVAAASLRRVGAARRPLPPSPLLSSLSSCLLMPAADPCAPFRRSSSTTLQGAGSDAAAWLWRVAPRVRLRRLERKGTAHPRLRPPLVFDLMEGQAGESQPLRSRFGDASWATGANRLARPRFEA